MCGLTIHMVNKLWKVMAMKNGMTNKLTVKELQKLKITSRPHVFMYAWHKCGYSRDAFNHIKSTLKVDPDDFTIVDVKEYKYICSKSTWTKDKYPDLIKPDKMASDENIQLNQLMGHWCMLEKWNWILQLFYFL